MTPCRGAPLLDRSPQPLVVGVVVDEDDLVPRVVEAQQRAQRLDDHAGRLVVRRDVQADQRKLAARRLAAPRRRPGGAAGRGDPAAPLLGAERVADLPQVGAGQHRGEDLEEPQQQAAGGAGRAEVAGEGPLERVHQVDDEQEDARRPAQVGPGVPAPGHREPDQARGGQPGDGVDRVVLGDLEQAQHRDDDPGQHRGAPDREREAPDRGPGAGRREPVAGLNEQGRRAQRRRDDPGQHERCEHRTCLHFTRQSDRATHLPDSSVARARSLYSVISRRRGQGGKPPARSAAQRRGGRAGAAQCMRWPAPRVPFPRPTPEGGSKS